MNTITLRRSASRPRGKGNGKAERRDENINIRAPRQTKELIHSAASLEGKSLTEFVLDSARKHAIDVLLDKRLFALGATAYGAFIKALDSPRPAGPRLKALMKRTPLWQK